MTPCNAGDVVLVRYPFTDLTTSKKRPAIVLSPSEYVNRFGDVVLMPLTSQTQEDSSLALSRWQASGLPKPTWIKPLIGTLSVRLIERGLGSIHQEDEDAVRVALAKILAARWRA